MSVNKSNIILIIILSLSFLGIYNYTQPTAIKGSQVHIKRVAHKVPKIKHLKKHNKNNNWYADGLNKRQQIARGHIVYLESRGRWNATNGTCWGRFQLKSSYLGYVHGRVNLNHLHQVKVADKYVQSRYGTWTKAYRFHLRCGWY